MELDDAREAVTEMIVSEGELRREYAELREQLKESAEGFRHYTEAENTEADNWREENSPKDVDLSTLLKEKDAEVDRLRARASYLSHEIPSSDLNSIEDERNRLLYHWMTVALKLDSIASGRSDIFDQDRLWADLVREKVPMGEWPTRIIQEIEGMWASSHKRENKTQL